MQAYETFATVEELGQVRVAGVPFAPGTEVEVTISPRRPSGEEFAAAWRRVCGQLRGTAQREEPSDEDIQKEIEAHRAGR